MSYLASYMAALEAGIQIVPPAELEAAIRIGGGSAALTQSSFASGSVTVSTGDFIIVTCMTRTGATPRTHDSLAPTGWACTFTKLPDVPQADTSGSANLRITMWWGIVSADGSGVVTLTTSGSTFQQSIQILRVPGGATVQAYATGSDQSGTTQTAAWNTTPDAAGLSIVATLNETVANTPDISAHDPIADFAGSLGSSPKWTGWQKLGSPANPVSVTGMPDARAQLVAAMQITGAA